MSIRELVDTINRMVEKMENYEYAEDGFEDTEEYNDLKLFAQEYQEGISDYHLYQKRRVIS